MAYFSIEALLLTVLTVLLTVFADVFNETICICNIVIFSLILQLPPSHSNLYNVQNPGHNFEFLIFVIFILCDPCRIVAWSKVVDNKCFVSFYVISLKWFTNMTSTQNNEQNSQVSEIWLNEIQLIAASNCLISYQVSSN